ncbi:MAG: hypothetical protein ACLPZM_05630 [Thermoplasmata archaeon]
MPLPIPPPPRRTLLVVIVAVVVVLLVVGFLALTGVFTPGSGHNGQGLTEPPVSYSQVASVGADAVQGEIGGPWTLVAVEGFGLSSSASGAVVSGTLDDGCTAYPAPGAPSAGTLPATPTGSPPGTSALWMFLATNDSEDVLIVAVTWNASAPIFIISGSCTGQFTDLGSLAGLSVVNSTQVALAANGDGGSTFLADNPGAFQSFVLLGPGVDGSDLPYWAVEYNTCGLATTGTGSQIVGVYDAENGAEVAAPTTSSVDC